MLLLWSVVVAGGRSELSGWIFLRPVDHHDRDQHWDVRGAANVGAILCPDFYVCSA